MDRAEQCRLALHRSRQAAASSHVSATGPRTMARAFIESFNGNLRDELLNEEIFDTLDDARRKIAL